MEFIADLLIKYSNLILVVITGVYAYLTWKMVSEMKKAREMQSDSHLIAYPVSMGTIHAQIQLENAGPGSALDVELSISLDPPLQTVKKLWRHPALLVNQKEFFLIPQNSGGSLDSLQQLGERHDNLILNLKWKNVFGHDKSSSVTYNLRELAEGWYNAGNLIKSEDIPSQLQKVTKSLDEIHKDIEKISRDIHSQQNAEKLKQINNKKPKTSRKKKATK